MEAFIRSIPTRRGPGVARVPECHIHSASGRLGDLASASRTKRVPGRGVRPSLAPRELTGLDEYAAKQLLAAEGIPVLDEILAANAEEVRDASARLGGPVALKVASPDIAHKTEVGGVVLDLSTPETAAAAAVAMLAGIRERLPAARLTGILVAPCAKGAWKLFVASSVTRSSVRS